LKHELRLLQVLLIAGVCVPALPGKPLRGSVRSNGKAIPGASVAVACGGQKINTTTGEDGVFQLETGTEPCTVRVEMFGFIPKESPSGSENLEMEMEMELAPRPALPAKGTARAAEQTLQAIPDAEPAAESISQVQVENSAESFLLSGSLSQALSSTPAAGPDEGRGNGAGGFAEGAVPGMPPGMGTEAEAGARGAARAGGAPRGPQRATAGPGGRRAARPAVARRAARPNPSRSFGNRRRRGQDAIRGTAFWTFRDSTLDARPFSLTGHTVDKANYSQNRFGVSVGGPLRIPFLLSGEKTTFFVSYTGVRSSNPFSAVTTLPTAVERAGNFSNSGSNGPVTVFDPTTGQPFANNIIPFSRINPAARGLLNLIPSPNQPGRVQNYQFVTSVPLNNENISVRLNQTVTQRDRFALTVATQKRESQQSQVYGFMDDSSGRGWNGDFTWTRTFTRRSVNTLRLTYNRNRNEMLPFFAYGRNWANDLGIRGTSQDELNYGPPNLNFTNFGGLTDASPVLRRDQTMAASEGFTYTKGKHNLSLGGDYRRIQHNNRTDQNGRGTFTFTGLATSGFDALRNPLAFTGFDFADFLLGLPQSGSIRYGSSSNYFRGSTYSAYVQDDWRVKAGFSLNLGLRYEYASPFHEKRNQMANLDVAPGFTGVAVVTPGDAGPYSGVFPNTLIYPDRNNIAPRVAAAWKPWQKRRTTIRAGYGIYYNNSVYTGFASRLASQPPFAQTSTVNTSAGNVLTLQDGFTTTARQTIRNTFAIDPNYRLGYAQSWSLTVQQELPRSFVLEAAYLGTKGTRLDIQRQPNRAAPGSPLDAETRRLIGNAVGFTYDSSEGNSIYHASQWKLTRRFRRGISMNALYTFAKSIDNVSTFGGGGTVVAQDDRNLANERGLSSFDRRHTINLTYFLMSPVGQAGRMQLGGWGGRILKNWSLGGGWTIMSGSPFTARVLGNRADTNGTGVIGSGRADSTGLSVDSDTGFFNTSAFTLPPSTRFGNAGRNTIPGPWNASLNASLGRTFNLTDRKRLEIRMESQNITNHVNITGISAVINALNYGFASAAGPMRTVSAQVRLRF